MTQDELTALFERLRATTDDIILTMEEASAVFDAAKDMANIVMWHTHQLIGGDLPLLEDDEWAYRAACAVKGEPVDESYLEDVVSDEGGDE